MYSTGQGVPQDKVSAYMWMTVASGGMGSGSSHDELGAKMTELAAKMTAQEIAKGQNLAKEWKPSDK
jgi:TPR repeat protein